MKIDIGTAPAKRAGRTSVYPWQELFDAARETGDWVSIEGPQSLNSYAKAIKDGEIEGSSAGEFTVQTQGLDCYHDNDGEVVTGDRKELVRDEDGEPVLDEGGKRQFEIVEENAVMPGTKLFVKLADVDSAQPVMDDVDNDDDEDDLFGD